MMRSETRSFKPSLRSGGDARNVDCDCVTACTLQSNPAQSWCWVDPACAFDVTGKLKDGIFIGNVNWATGQIIPAIPGSPQLYYKYCDPAKPNPSEVKTVWGSSTGRTAVPYQTLLIEYANLRNKIDGITDVRLRTDLNNELDIKRSKLLATIGSTCPQGAQNCSVNTTRDEVIDFLKLDRKVQSILQVFRDYVQSEQAIQQFTSLGPSVPSTAPSVPRPSMTPELSSLAAYYAPIPSQTQTPTAPTQSQTSYYAPPPMAPSYYAPTAPSVPSPFAPSYYYAPPTAPSAPPLPSVGEINDINRQKQELENERKALAAHQQALAQQQQYCLALHQKEQQRQQQQQQQQQSLAPSSFYSSSLPTTLTSIAPYTSSSVQVEEPNPFLPQYDDRIIFSLGGSNNYSNNSNKF